MKTAYTVSTALFFLLIAGFWAASVLMPAAAPPATAAERLFTLAEVARHDRAQDCWMVIAETVYDFTEYLPQHPSDPAIAFDY